MTVTPATNVFEPPTASPTSGSSLTRTTMVLRRATTISDIVSHLQVHREAGERSAQPLVVIKRPNFSVSSANVLQLAFKLDRDTQSALTMGTRDNLHSTSSISLRELDVSSRPASSHLSSSSNGSRSRDDDQDQESSEPRGAGTAAPPGTNSGDASGDTPETASTWHRLATRVTEIWGSNVSCEVEHSTSRDHLGTSLHFVLPALFAITLSSTPLLPFSFTVRLCGITT